MDLYSYITIAFTISVPLAIIVCVCRALLSIYRSIRARHTRSALFAFLSIIGLLSLLSIVAVVWFGYGVAHTAKDGFTDLKVMAVTLIPSYVGVYLAWRLYRYLERDFVRNAG